MQKYASKYKNAAVKQHNCFTAATQNYRARPPRAGFRSPGAVTTDIAFVLFEMIFIYVINL